MGNIRSIGLLLICAAMLAAVSGYANDPKRIERRTHPDSTVLTLSGVPKGTLHRGEKFTARIHVKQSNDWQITSVKGYGASNDCCFPTKVLIPDSLQNLFELVSLKETGKVICSYDSDMEATRSYHREPFDLLATIKVRETVKGAIPFRLFVGYMAINKASKQCLPPCWYEVSLKKQEFATN